LKNNNRKKVFQADKQ